MASVCGIGFAFVPRYEAGGRIDRPFRPRVVGALAVTARLTDRVRVVAAAALLLLPVMARAQQQESAPPPPIPTSIPSRG
jgi:hypothetical protein